MGFRPHTYKLATRKQLSGYVRNDMDGVHVLFNSKDRAEAEALAQEFVQGAPGVALIRDVSLNRAEPSSFDGFRIAESNNVGPADLLLTPDLAMCSECRKEMRDTANRRYAYPFITCTQCGPRYSIITGLPYDRPFTSMDPFRMCPDCEMEYHNILDRRHYSQTNSCHACRVSMEVVTQEGALELEQEDIVPLIIDRLQRGDIVAVKGIGGYVLICDATDPKSIQNLRNRKQRPEKPLAVMYPSEEYLRREFNPPGTVLDMLNAPVSPIVVIPVPVDYSGTLAVADIAPGLDRVGVVLPYTGLFQLIMDDWQRPLVFTSGNLSGSPIIFNDDVARGELFRVADMIVANDREIVTPQDDSVLKYCPLEDDFVILRRSRGLAPALLSGDLDIDETTVAMGADLKSAFGVNFNGQTIISQYLGDLGNLLSRDSFVSTFDHIGRLFDYSPRHIVVDRHPGYWSTALGRKLSNANGASVTQVQHHKAHFAAVLSENQLLEWKEPVLGVIMDGTGYGDDGQIWGGEFFMYNEGHITRKGHLHYFPHIAGDKMSREPRLSAFSIFGQLPEAESVLKSKFSQTEWDVYSALKTDRLLSSSAGRMFDAVASIVSLCDMMTYEGQAAMLLEKVAQEAYDQGVRVRPYSYTIGQNFVVDLRPCLIEIVDSVHGGTSAGNVALRFHETIANLIVEFAELLHLRDVCLSGGVFQNTLLVHLMRKHAPDDFAIYTHKELSPNDENIAYGQLATVRIDELYHNKSKNNVPGGSR